MNISFEKIVSKSKIQNHENGSDLAIQEIEYRRDPITGRICTVLVGIAEKMKLLGETDRDLIKRIAEETEKTCPFCPEAVETVTPIFPKKYFALGSRIVMAPNPSQRLSSEYIPFRKFTVGW